MNDTAFFSYSTEEDFSYVLEFSGIDLTDRDFEVKIKDRASSTTRATLTAGAGLTVTGANIFEAAYALSDMTGWPTGEYSADVVDVTDGAHSRIMAVRFVRALPGRLVDGVQNRKAFIKWSPNQAVVTATGAIGPAGPPGPQGEQGIQGLPGEDGADGTNGADGADGADGANGWTPEIAIATDGARRVQQIVDWVGGTGTKPATGDYVGATGLVPNIEDGVDIRGDAGTATIPDGNKGDITTSDDGDTWDINTGAVGAAELADSAVSNAKLADMAQATFKMRASGAGTGAPIDGTAAQVKTALGVTSAGDAMITAASATAQTALLSALVGDIGTGGVKGLVPAPAAGDGAAGKVLGAGGGWVSPSAGALVLIQSQVASSSATVDFTSGLDNTYDSYVVQIDSAKPSTDDVLLVMRVGTGGGPTWQASGYRTSGQMIRAGTSTAVVQALTSTNSVLLVYSFATAGIGNASGENYSGTVNFSNPEATDFCEIRFAGEYGAALPDTCFISGGGRYDVAGAITGIRFLMSSGNIASGRFSLYGIKKV